MKHLHIAKHCKIDASFYQAVALTAHLSAEGELFVNSNMSLENVKIEFYTES